MNRTYELIYVLKPDASESEVNDLHKQVAEIVERMGGTIDKTENALKVTEGLLRHLVVRVDEDAIKAERARTKRTEESRRRRVARGLPPDRQPGEGPQGDNDDDSGDMMFDGADMEA